MSGRDRDAGDRPAVPETQELLRLLLEQGEDYALFLMAPDGKITDWFRGAEHVFGYAAHEVIGRPATHLFNQDDIDRGAEKQEFEVARSGGRAEDDRWHVRKDGTHFWGSGVLFALRDAAEKPIAFAKLVRNRTDVKSQTEALENQVKALSKAHDQKNLFLGMLAHELRNPLNALVNALELIRRSGPVDPMGLAGLQVIDRQAAVLRRLTDDLMDTIRISAGKIDLQLQVIDLKDVANAAAASARPLVQARSQELEVILIEGPVLVNADPLRLQQVFANLLDNAIKYTPLKGRILFNLTTEGGDAIVRVEDTGMGMTAEVLPKVFELFTQEESSRQVAPGGVGLGLPLVRQLVVLHGGTVQARSDGRNKGSIFTVRLPLYRAPQA